MTRLIRRVVLAMVAASAGIVLHGQPTTAENTPIDLDGIDLGIGSSASISASIRRSSATSSTCPPVIRCRPFRCRPLQLRCRCSNAAAAAIPALPVPALPVPSNPPAPEPPIPDPDVGEPAPPITIPPSPVPDARRAAGDRRRHLTEPRTRRIRCQRSRTRVRPADTRPRSAGDLRSRRRRADARDRRWRPRRGDQPPLRPVPTGRRRHGGAPVRGDDSLRLPRRPAPLSDDPTTVDARDPGGDAPGLSATPCRHRARGSLRVEADDESWVPTAAGATWAAPRGAGRDLRRWSRRLWIVIAAVRRAINRRGQWADEPIDLGGNRTGCRRTPGQPRGNPQAGCRRTPGPSGGNPQAGCRRTPGPIGGNLDRASADARSMR